MSWWPWKRKKLTTFEVMNHALDARERVDASIAAIQLQRLETEAFIAKTVREMKEARTSTPPFRTPPEWMTSSVMQEEGAYNETIRDKGLVVLSRFWVRDNTGLWRYRDAANHYPATFAVPNYSIYPKQGYHRRLPWTL